MSLVQTLAVALTVLIPVQSYNVVIAGAGPAGLLAAHCLLARNTRVSTKWNVSVFEARGDPREASAGARAYSLGLNIRGRTAIEYFDKKYEHAGRSMWRRIAASGVESDSFFLHIGTTKIQLRQNTNDTVPTLLTGRNELCASMITELESLYPPPSDLLTLNFNVPLVDVNLSTRTCTFADRMGGVRHVPYDLLVGADGVGSVVRSSMQAQLPSFSSEEVILPGEYKVALQDMPPLLEQNAIHAMSGGKSGYTLFTIPAKGGKACTLYSWPTEPEIFATGTVAEIQARVAEDYPLYGVPTEDAIAQLKAQRSSIAKTVRANVYHDLSGRVMLLGDSAHSTGGTLGQGCNSAVCDVVAFDKALDETNDSIEQALQLYSHRQVKEGLSLWQLLQLPPPGPLGFAYFFVQTARGLLSRLKLPIKIAPPTQTLLSQTLTPYSEIVQRNKFWVETSLRMTGGRVSKSGVKSTP